MKTTFCLSIIFFAIVFAPSCKKKDVLSTPTPVNTIPPTTSEVDLLKDSIYLYAKEVYLWHEVIPSYNIFNPRHFTAATELEAAQNEMAGIRDLQVEDKKHHYSFVTTQDTANSVLYSRVIPNGAKKTGYLVFNQFFGDVSRTELTNAFNDFNAQGINELIVDLRYNHGGSTQTQDALANLIAPLSANGKTMYTYIFNDSLTAGKFPLLKRRPDFSDASFKPGDNTVAFQKNGNLNLSRVFFIVTRETASASELLINNLRPYLDVKLVGDTTYGKPVGFFPISIFNYVIYPISFKTVNSAGSAEYYDGFAPDILARDGVNNNWGDLNDPSLASALHYMATGSFNRSVTIDDEEKRMLTIQKQYQPLNISLFNKKFTGMFTESKH